MYRYVVVFLGGNAVGIAMINQGRLNYFPSGCPTVTIVIPARDEEHYIIRCIRSIQNLHFPRERLEIILVDNGSKDNTAALASSAGARVLALPNERIGKVRNFGARAGTGDIVAFLDADCVAPRGWLEAAKNLLRQEEVGIVGGDCKPDPNGTWVERVWASPRPGPERIVRSLPGACLAFRREIFERVGGFDESVIAGEDDQICAAVRRAGYKVISAPECAVIHLGYPKSLREVARRQYWHGSSQLTVAESWREPQLVLTHIYLAGIVFFIPLSWAFGLAGVVGSLLLIAMPVGILAAKKSKGRDDDIGVFLRMCALGVFFYFGRASGLLKNYFMLLVSPSHDKVVNGRRID